MASTLRGQLDSVDRGLIRGWAQDARLPAQPVSLLVTVNGTLLGRILANRYRQDLADAGLGDGRHAFELRLDNALSPVSPHLVRITRELDGAELDRSPWLLEPATLLDDAALERLAGLLADGIEDRARLDQRLGFLLRQVDRLLEISARDDGAAPRPAKAGAPGWRGARSTGPAAENALPGGRRALVVDELTPDNRRDAGSCALLSHMRSLQRLGFQVLFAPADGEADGNEALADRLAASGIGVCAAPYYASVEEALRRHGSALDLVYLHRGSVAFRYGRLVRHHAPRARLLYAVADLEHLRLQRQAEAEERPELLPLARQVRTRELDAARLADAVLTHSTREAALLAQAVPHVPVHVVHWAVPARPVAAPFEAREGLAFLADYAHAPNLDAARRLLCQVMPLVWEHAPDMPCLLAGSRMPPELAGNDPRVVPIGHVPDLAQLFNRVRLTAAPLAYGAGIKGKVLESLAAGVPCVCSPVAAEGLGLPDALACCVALDTHGIARAILRLHRDAELNRSVAAAGLDWAAATLSEASMDRLLHVAAERAATRNP